MKVYNKRLNHIAEVRTIDYAAKIVKLVQPESNPIFVYEENLDNIVELEYTGVILGGDKVYVGDKITDGDQIFTVQKVPGGYSPFITPVRKNFNKAD